MKNEQFKISWICLLIVLCFSSCREEPKPLPLGQLRLALPSHNYEATETSCPYVLVIPSYAEIKERNAPENSCWSDLRFPTLNGTVHLTYRALDNDLPTMLEESHKLTYDHHIKADNIDSENFAYTEKKVFGTIYQISGNVASNIQFHATDSTDHFLRGSLYFNTIPNKDSLAPVVDHLKVDLDELLKNLSWKSENHP